jgi:hypothetical protein
MRHRDRITVPYLLHGCGNDGLTSVATCKSVVSVAEESQQETMAKDADGIRTVAFLLTSKPPGMKKTSRKIQGGLFTKRTKPISSEVVFNR